jgi:prepilin-type N-terminal cleavage/methylation domain-containing protein
MKNRAGFTLIEIMVSLVLVGLIASIAGTSVLTATRGYVFARENNAITQKAQLALNRLNREFIELSDIRDANSTCVVYESPYGRRAVASVGGAIRYFPDYASATCPTSGGDILVDGVQSFSILYNPNPNGTASLWSLGQDIRNLFALNVQLALARPDTGGTVPFFTTVSPRNNNNSGGASLPTAANPPPEYSGKQCFVTTAAYGDSDHPVVEMLRQFRDRVLLPTDPGKAFVRFYYEVGPSLAAAIEDKPIACLFVRLLLTPVAGFAFLALSWPVLIPVILLLSWGLARVALEALRRRSSRWTAQLQGQRGAILVTLIAAMVVFAALGAVMIGMFGTSALSQVAGNNTLKAYYLAESGFRYAASEYINASGDTARETQMAAMHNKTNTLAGGDGKFDLAIYPYYYNVKRAPSGIHLDTSVSGGLLFNSGDFMNGSWVQLQRFDGTVSYEKIWGASVITDTDGKPIVQFTRMSGTGTADWDSAIPVGTKVTPMCVPNRNAGLALADNGDLTFVLNSGARIFPAQNGTFSVRIVGEPNPRFLRYRQLDLANNKLKGIHDPEGVSLTGKTLEDPGTVEPYSNRFISLTKFAKVESTGTFGTGSAAVSRKVTYYMPIGYAGLQPELKKEFKDQMANLTNWQASDHIGRIGTFTAGTSYGSTMRVSTDQAVNTLPGGSCLKFREFQVGINSSVARVQSGEFLHTAVQQEWLRAGNYLGYDLEMKTFYTLINPMARHALGLTFRLDESGNALGFTYARGIPGFDQYGCDNDGIPFGFLANIPGYTNYTPVLLFWMKQYAKQEPGLDIDLSPHSVAPVTINDPPPVGRGTYAIHSYNPEYFWTTGERVRFTNTGGALPPGIIPGRDYYIRKVVYNFNTYLYLFVNETAALNFDPLWPGLVDITDYGTGTTTIIAQDPTFTKLAHQVLTSGNEYLGLIASLSYLKSWATFMARVIEAPSVSFVSGGGSAGREILSGETVYQTSNNLPGGTVTAVYRVMRSPVYRAAKSGNRLWSSGSEQGVLLLERISGNALSNPSTAPFTGGSTIFVGEHPGGTNAGTVGVGGVSDAVFRQRDNWLMFSVGDPTGKDPADTNPFNNYRGPVLRNSILWPSDNPEETVINTDAFTLLRFSDYLNASLSCRVNGVGQTGSYCLTRFFTKNNDGSAGDVLRFASPDGSMFYSPQSGTVFPTGRAEFGLHAYGMDGHFTEFDDFALQFGPGYSITRKGFLMPIQQ